MARLIDADELANWIIRELRTMPNGVFNALNGRQAANLIGKSIDEAPTVGCWISVKDRLPGTNDEVLTTYLYDDKPNKRYIESASYFDDGDGEGHWCSVWDEYRISRVRKTTIAWMPMPKPYKPSKEDNGNGNY
jgi:hypothetical protein